MNFRKVSINSAWLLLEKIVRSVMTIFVGALVVKQLGPEQYGQIAYVVAIVSLFQSIASLGLEGVLVREILVFDAANKNGLIDNKNNNGKISIKTDFDNINTQLLISAAFSVRLIVGVVLLILSIIFVGLLKEWSQNAIMLTILMGGPLIFQASDIFDLWNQSRLNSKLTAILKILSYILSNSIRIYLISIDAAMIWFAAAFFVEASVVGIGLYLAFTHDNRMQYNIKIQTKIIKNLIKETWPISIASLAAAAYTRFDQISLENYLGTVELGIYSSALLFATATYFLPGIICASIMPEAVKAKRDNYNKYLEIMRYTYSILLLISLSIFAITYVAGDLIFSIFYTVEFAEGVAVLKLYALTNIPVYMGVAHGIWMVNDKKLIVSVYRAVLGAVTAIVLCLLFVPEYGMTGAVYSTISALIVADIIVPVAMNLQFFRSLIKYKQGLILK